MKTMCILLVVVLLTVLSSASILYPSQAASGTGYALTWSSLDGGGSIHGAETGYALSGTLSQPDALTWSSAHYRLQGGFWQEWLHRLFLPFLMR